MGIVDEIREAGERLGDKKDELTEKVSDLVGVLADSNADESFAVMRKVDPIVSLSGGVTVVALNEDVKEVLGDPARFTAHLYGPKMEAVTGPFILGVDDVPLYHHDHAALDRAVTREDLPAMAQRMYETAQGLVAARRDDGEIDVVTQLADPAIDSGIAAYLGTPGPDPRTHARWARNVFQELFITVGNLATVRERALADAARWREHLDDLIDARKSELENGEDVPDDVLTRLLRFQSEGEPNLHDIAIRHNILGNITGWIPTISNAFARIMDELLGREDELEGAQQAARDGNRELVAAYCFEASRFYPQNFALLRYVQQDTMIAEGTDRETAVKAGSTVFAATLSAMHDERAIEDPGAFRTDRPWSDYMLFGYGMHTCYGQQIVRAQLPAMAHALFDGPRLRRGRGREGKLRFEGPFPAGLAVRFDN
ncbi:MAG TPA: cytochrome P450 [Solirubrobacteraceae bacterium]|nr:cytochrome P450 [Solirubrobacteraceae bacterium]